MVGNLRIETNSPGGTANLIPNIINFINDEDLSETTKSKFESPDA